jgi:hypothetical protein
MNVALRNVREIEIEDVSDAVDVDAACGKIGRDENRHRSVAEALEGALARPLRLVAVDRLRADPAARDLLGEPIGAVLRARENDGPLCLLFAEEPLEQVALFGFGHQVNALVDAFGRRYLGCDVDAYRIAEDRADELGDRARNRRGEEERLPLRRDCRDDLPDVVDEPHVEHAVGFVEDEDLDAVESNETLRHQVEEATRRCDEHVRPTTKRVFLSALPDAAVDDDMAEAELATVRRHALADLSGKLTCRRHDERANLA